MVDQCQDTFQVLDCTLHLPEPGGGMVCMQILWNTVEAVHNVLLSQEGVNNIDLFLDPFLFSECSRSLDWTSWIFLAQTKVNQTRDCLPGLPKQVASSISHT